MPVVAYTGAQWLFIVTLIIVGLALKAVVLLWLHRDIVRRKREPLPWVIVGVFVDLIVLVVWLVVRPPLPGRPQAARPVFPLDESARRATSTFGAPPPQPAPVVPDPPIAPLPGQHDDRRCAHCGRALDVPPHARAGTPVPCGGCGLFTTI